MTRVQGTIFHRALPVAVVAVALAVPVRTPIARAQGATPAAASEEARAAYDRGTAAHARGDYRAAANELARADALAPNPVALRAALDEALLADDAELGMHLVERARVRARGDATLAPSVRDATQRFAGRTGRIRIDCGGRACHASVDARPVDVAAAAIVLVGPHRIAIDLDGVVTAKDVLVAADREVDVVLPPPAPPPAPPAVAATPPAPLEGSKGIAKGWFVTALGFTAVAGGLAIASAADTAGEHSSFVARGCPSGGDPGCSTLASDGRYVQERTNILATVAGAFALTTITVAFFVDWRARPSASGPKTAALVVGDRTASLRVLF